MELVLSRWREEWNRFARQKPGRRFFERYERRRHDRAGRPWWRRAISIVLGILLLLVGAFFAVAPGPAVVFFALGGLLIANESAAAARALDWIDRLIAPLLRWVSRRWNRLSPRTRRILQVVIILWTAVGLVAGLILLR